MTGQIKIFVMDGKPVNQNPSAQSRARKVLDERRAHYETLTRLPPFEELRYSPAPVEPEEDDDEQPETETRTTRSTKPGRRYVKGQHYRTAASG